MSKIHSFKIALLSLLGITVTTSQSALAQPGFAPARAKSNNEDHKAIDANLAFDQGAGYLGRRQSLPVQNEAIARDAFSELGFAGDNEAADGKDLVSISTFGYGLSLPAKGDGTVVPDGKVNDVLPGPVSRREGGEFLTIDFVDSTYKKKIGLKISGLRLVAFSKSGKGKILINGAASVTLKGEPSRIQGLNKFSDLPAGSQGENHKDKIMLKAGDAVTVAFKNPIDAATLRLAVEAYGHNDASLVVIVQYAPLEGTKLYGLFTRRAVMESSNPPRVGNSRPSTGWPGSSSGAGSTSRPSIPDPEPAHTEPPGHQREGSSTYGNQRYYSAGGSSSTYGNQTYYSRGGSSSTYGNQTYFSNGGSSSTYGNQTYFSNGGSASTYGNQTYFSNGGSCSTYGGQTYCN